MQQPDDLDVTRRSVLLAGAATAAGITTASSQASPPVFPRHRQALTKTRLKVNGVPHDLDLDPRTSLLDALREHLQLTGTKKGCDHGQCGACTILLNGERINSCLTLAIMHDDDEITTIEGMEQAGKLHPMQAAFIEHDGFQCGYCTSGQICSAIGTLREIAADIPSHASTSLTTPSTATELEIRERMSGNICRCGAYANIVMAITQIARSSA
ncbi:MAG: 2Fe-2S iron-sulfur cluster-binding protein [Pseudomonadota bacterium]